MKLAVDFILILGIGLNILALWGLLRLKKKQIPQTILIVFWVFILGILVYFYSNLHGLTTLNFIANYIEDGARFIIPPLIYVYVKSIFLGKANLIRNNALHFVPFILYFLLYTLPQSLSLDFLPVRWINRYIELALVMDLYGIFYFVLSLRLFYAVDKTMKHSYSNLTNRDFLWLEKFLLSFLMVLVIDLFITISEMSFGYSVSWDGYITVFFIIVAMTYIGYYGLTQSTIFLPAFLVEGHILKSNAGLEQKPYLKEKEKDVLKEKFDQLMNGEKLYLLPDLNLKMLAYRMEVSERALSAFFNEVLSKNFYDSINDLRVVEAKKRLVSDKVKNLSIVGIGLSSGFNSKSSFYRVFKNRTGMSPSAYMENHINGSQYPQ